MAIAKTTQMVHEITPAHKHFSSFFATPYLFLPQDRGDNLVSVMYKTIFVINIIIYMCLQHSNVL